jgi:ElaB/YqjD/DUF883 family membrane-anchored ribosome-binding protein
MPNRTDAIDDIRDAARGLSNSAEAEIAELRRKVETLMNDRVTPMVSRVAGEAESAARDVADAVRRNSDSLVDEIRARPVTSLGIAVAAGFVLAHLLRR